MKWDDGSAGPVLSARATWALCGAVIVMLALVRALGG